MGSVFRHLNEARRSKLCSFDVVLDLICGMSLYVIRKYIHIISTCVGVYHYYSVTGAFHTYHVSKCAVDLHRSLETNADRWHVISAYRREHELSIVWVPLSKDFMKYHYSMSLHVIQVCYMFMYIYIYTYIYIYIYIYIYYIYIYTCNICIHGYGYASKYTPHPTLRL